MPETLPRPDTAPASTGAARGALVSALRGARAIRGPHAAGRAETLVFRLAMAAAALWVLDDAFWHREPGTSVGDHLASGLVPVALAALLALAYPRLRARRARRAALTAGPLMIVAGVVDGARHVAVDRLGGDDVTAILAGVAGAVLVVLGAAVLWRSRRLRRAAAAALPAAGARRGRRGGRRPLRRHAGRVRDRRQPQGAGAGGEGRTSGGRTSTCR